METQHAGAEEGFTQVIRKGARRAKKRKSEQLSEAGESGDAGRMDTEESQPAKRPVFPPLTGDGLLVLSGTLALNRSRGHRRVKIVVSG